MEIVLSGSVRITSAKGGHYCVVPLGHFPLVTSESFQVSLETVRIVANMPDLDVR